MDKKHYVKAFEKLTLKKKVILLSKGTNFIAAIKKSKNKTLLLCEYKGILLEVSIKKNGYYSSIASVKLIGPSIDSLSKFVDKFEQGKILDALNIS